MVHTRDSGVAIDSPEGSLIPIASVTRTQGLGGAVRVRIDFDDPRLFETGRSVVLTLAGRRAQSSIEDFRFQHGRWVLKLSGVDSISEAEGWIGGQISIAKGQLPEPEDGSYFDFQLTGCEVYENDERLGRVAGVIDYGGTDMLRVDLGGRDTLIPFVRDFLEAVDVGRKRIDVRLPEGLLDLNA